MRGLVLVKKLISRSPFKMAMKAGLGTINIRKAVETDMDDIYRVHTTAIQNTCSSHYSPDEVHAWVSRQEPHRYLPFIRRGEIVIAEARDEKVLGFGHCIPDTVLDQGREDQVSYRAVQIKGLFVDPEYNRKGVGGSLMKHLEKTASEQGAETLTVLSTLNAVEFYGKCGFDPLEIIKHQVSDKVHLQSRKMIKKLAD